MRQSVDQKHGALMAVSNTYAAVSLGSLAHLTKVPNTIVILCFAFALNACSAQQVQLSAPMTVASVDDGAYQLVNPVTIRAPRTAPLTLKAGTTWKQIGTIERGRVYDTSDQVVIVNSFDVQEAAVVVDNGMVVGYYLKISKTFVESDPVAINLITKE